MSDRYTEIAQILTRVLVVNLAVAAAKIALGYYTGAVSIVSVARWPPDANHPYGHRKYETMASIGIVVFLIIVLVEVLSAATDRFLNGGTPRVFPEGIAIMAITLAINVFVVSYELAAARRLRSEVLRADAKHTRSDVLTSGAVLGALVGVWLGYPILDPLAAVLVAVFIGHACWEIAQEASRILSDEIVIAEGEVREVLRTVPEVLGCEKIRTRGSADYVFLDLHLWLAPETPLQDAHARSHEAKDRLMARFPHLVDVVIHIEPPPIDAERLQVGVF